MALVSEEQKRKIHFRNTDFFLKNFKNVSQDVERDRIKEIIDVELQCLGYGVFQPKKLLQNFVRYTIDLFNLLQVKSQVKSLKIIINGFTLDPNNPILQQLARKIPNIKDNLNVLYFHTSNLKNTDLKDFNDLLNLSKTLADINFQQFSLQCANWSFNKKQPTFKQLQKIFEALIVDSRDLNKIQNKRFRLELSGWYYNFYDAKAFLGFKLNEDELKKVPQKTRAQYAIGEQFNEQRLAKERENFFKQMQNLVKGLLQVMDNIQQLQLDLRNAHDLLKFKDLKKILDNVTKDNRSQKSIMSKRIDVQADEAEKQLNLNIVV